MAYGPMNNYMEICNECGEFNDTFYKHWNMYWSIEETTVVPRRWLIIMLI